MDTECFPCFSAFYFRKVAMAFGAVTTRQLTAWKTDEAHHRVRYLQSLIGASSRIYANREIVNSLRFYHEEFAAAARVGLFFSEEEKVLRYVTPFFISRVFVPFSDFHSFTLHNYSAQIRPAV